MIFCTSKFMSFNTLVQFKEVSHLDRFLKSESFYVSSELLVSSEYIVKYGVTMGDALKMRRTIGREKHNYFLSMTKSDRRVYKHFSYIGFFDTKTYFNVSDTRALNLFLAKFVTKWVGMLYSLNSTKFARKAGKVRIKQIDLFFLKNCTELSKSHYEYLRSVGCEIPIMDELLPRYFFSLLATKFCYLPDKKKMVGCVDLKDSPLWGSFFFKTKHLDSETIGRGLMDLGDWLPWGLNLNFSVKIIKIINFDVRFDVLKFFSFLGFFSSSDK